MNIKELRTQTNKDYVKVSGKALKEHVEAVISAGVTYDVVIEQAFKELYEQVMKEKIGQTGTFGSIFRETIKTEPRGDVFVEVVKQSIPEKLVSKMEEHPDQSYTVDEIMSNFEMSGTYLYKILSDLQANGVVSSSNTRPNRYWLTKNGDPELKGLFPKGTKVEVQG